MSFRPVLARCLIAGLVSVSTASAQENPHDREGAASVPDETAQGGSAPGESSATVVRAKSELSAYADTDAVQVLTPALEASIANPISGWRASGSYLVDVVSAASVDIVSTASPHWVEVRHAASLGGTYKPDTFGVGLSGAVSREPDYLSLTAGGALSFEFADKTANPTVAYGFTSDTSGRKDTPFSVFSQKLQRHTVNAVLELIVDPLTLLGFTVDGIFESGDQSKPYRFLPLFAPDVALNVARGASPTRVDALRLPGRAAESTPLERKRLAIAGRVAQRLSGSTLILSERVYADDWGLEASTTDLRFVIDASRRVFVWTHLRGHVQSGVSFWHRAYAAQVAPGAPLRIPKLRTGDRELSPLSQGTFGAGLRWNVGAAARPTAWSLLLQADMFTTIYNDAIYIQTREGYLGVLQLEAEF